MSENKVTKRSDLFRAYARCIDMCEGTNIDPYACIKYNADNCRVTPNFNGKIEHYEFALAIVEDRPVFKGDVLWTKDGINSSIKKTIIDVSIDLQYVKVENGLLRVDCLTWQEPKRTIIINGTEYPAPVKNGNPNNCIVIQCVPYYFENANDFMAVRDALWNLLNGK